MAKALKTAALIVGAVALVATGVGAVALGGLAGTLTIGGLSASTLFLVSGGLTVAASLLQKTPKVTASQTERLSASIDPRAFRKSVLGQTACPVEIRYEEWSGKDQEYCDWIVLHASHAMDGIEEIWFDTEMAWSATTGVVGKWAGYFSIPHIVLEGSPANAFTFGSGRWNAASARLTGCAYSHWRFKVTGNGKKAESPFSGGLPSRITVIGRGAKLYDPRRDSTVPGGNGPMRADDQSTWRYTTDDGVTIGENLPLQILRVVLGWRIRNPSTGELKLATGSGVPARRLNLATFIDAANLADELVNRSAGGTEPRYHGAGVISEGDDPKASLDMLCTGCCGRFRDTGGKLSLVIAHNDLASAAIDDGLTDHDVVGAFTWDPDAALEATPNVVRGKYVDASANSLYQLIDYPEVRLPSPDGQDRFFPLDLGVVESPSQAQRIAKMVLQRKQYPREFSAPFDIRAWKYSVGDVVPFTFAALGFNRRIFRVKDQELGQGGVCNMTLTVETPALYAWDKDDVAPVQAADVIVYDSRNNPLILAIADAGTTANWDGVTGAGRPADNATNSADPTSPFGPDGTVGGTVKQLSDFDAAIAAARKYQDALDSDTIPAINKAVADAGDRITAARKAADDALDGLTDEAARAAKAEGHLSDRIDSLVAEGGYDDTDVRAAITRVEEAYVKADAGIARRIDNVQTSLDGVDSAIDAKAREVTIAYTQADKALADRAETLEASAKSINTALNGPDGVQARLSSYGSTLADLPNRYAAASDVATLLSQVNFATDSGLLRTVTSRIEDRASAIADAKAGAVAETYRGITADLNGRVGKVEERTGAIAGIDGRTTVYWEVLGTTGDGKTRVRLSKSDGSRGVFYVDADMVVDGNLLVAGSVTTKTIAANNITQPLSAQTTTVKQISWQDANPNYGVEVTVANPIGAPIRIDFRYSQQGGGQGGQPPFTVQIQRVSPNGDTYNFSDASYIGGIILDTSPPAGAYVTYRFYFKHQYASGQGTTNVIYQQLFALEMRR
jgi:hypothetical protein